jgi:predicted ATP-grasp superfamily ATP-dependent carboligase
MAKAIHKLAIVGASARAAAFSALRAGYEVVAADLFADADLERLCPASRITGYPEGFADWLATTDCDGWLYTGGVENHPQLVDRMAQLRPLLGTAGAALHEVRNPERLQRVLTRDGLNFPETCFTADGLPLDGSWLCKTYRAAGGAGVWRLDGAVARERADSERAVFQRHIPGDAYAATFVANSGGEAMLLGVTRQFVGWNPAKPWQYVGSVGPLSLAVGLLRQIKSMGAVLSTEFNLRGVFGVDFIIDGGDAWIVEVNPRYTASVEVLERAAGKSAISIHVPYCGPYRPAAGLRSTGRPFLTASSRVHGKAIVFAPQTVRISPSFFKWTMEQTKSADTDPWLADLPNEGEEIAEGRPILTVFSSGATVDECEHALRRNVAMIEWRPFGYGR